MDKKIKILIVILFIIVFFIPIYFLAKMDFFNSGIPPGCRKINSLLDAAQVDVCTAKFIIINTKISPEISCIKLNVNNCNISRSIGLKNECDEDIYIEGKKIQQGANNAIAFYKEAPSIDTFYNVLGKIGDRDFNISYTLTKKQCD